MDIHKDIINSYEEYKKAFRTDNKWTTADRFTKKILDYAKNEDLMFSENWHRLLFDLVERNNKKSPNDKTPYTAEKPNFAILISIVKNHQVYSKEYGIDFLKEILMWFEESALTGVFGKDGDINLQKYYRVVYQFFKKYLRHKFSETELNNISNTLVYVFLEEIDRLKEIDTPDDIRNKKRTRTDSMDSIDSKSKNTKKTRAEGIKKRNTIRKKKNINKIKKKLTKYKYQYKQRVTKKN